MTKRVAILISGGGSNMEALVQDMAQDDVAKPVLVLANVPDAGGLAKARAHGIATACVNHKDYPDRPSFESALTEALEAVAPDIICLAGFMRILTPGFIARWQGKMLNIHPSILPLFRGLHTHQRVLEVGMAVHGCTVHEVTGELDGGPILGQAVIPVLPGDTPVSLAERLLPMEHRLYPAVLRKFATSERGKVALLVG